MYTKKQKLLAKHLETKPSQIIQTKMNPNVLSFDGEEYFVFDDDDADYYAKEQIKETLWAFNASFLSAHTDLDEDQLRPILDMQENANPILLKLISDLDHFCNDAMSSDGRGHFISHYDGEEIELGNGFFAYKL